MNLVGTVPRFGWGLSLTVSTTLSRALLRGPALVVHAPVPLPGRSGGGTPLSRSGRKRGSRCRSQLHGPVGHGGLGAAYMQMVCLFPRRSLSSPNFPTSPCTTPRAFPRSNRIVVPPTGVEPARPLRSTCPSSKRVCQIHHDGVLLVTSVRHRSPGHRRLIGTDLDWLSPQISSGQHQYIPGAD